MGHPKIDEFIRIKGHDSCRPEFFRGFQRLLREEINPKLDELERVSQENHDLRNQLQALQLKAAVRRKERDIAGVTE